LLNKKRNSKFTYQITKTNFLQTIKQNKKMENQINSTENKIADSTKNVISENTKTISQNSDKAKKLIEKSETKKENNLFASLQTFGSKSNLDVSKVKQNKDFIYQFQKSENRFTDKEQKKQRNKIRTKLINLIQNIELNSKRLSLAKETEKANIQTELKKDFDTFLKFYSETYINKSISDKSKFSNLSEEKRNSVSQIIDIICNNKKDFNIEKYKLIS
jgi:hypothetical protein